MKALLADCVSALNANALTASAQLVSALADKRLSRASVRAVYDVVQASVFDYDLRALNHTMLMLVKTHQTSCTAMQMTAMRIGRTDVVCNPEIYIIKALALLDVCSYDKETKTVTFNTDNELYQSLVASAQYRLEDDTLLTNSEYENIMIYAVQCKLIPKRINR